MINNQWVLTAAHLFDGLGNTRNGWENDLLLTFGGYIVY